MEQDPQETRLSDSPPSQAVFRKRLAQMMAVAGFALAVVGLFTRATWPLGSVLMALGTVLFAVAAYTLAGLRKLGGTESLEFAGSSRQRERAGTLERLKDAQWEIADRNLQFRKALDAQQDYVVQRAWDGHVVFANIRFCQAFDVSAEDIVGTMFYPPVVASEQASATLLTERRIVQLVRTVDGERWIAWDQHEVPNAAGGYDVQSVGRDITSDRQAQDELKDACDQAEAASRSSSRFLAFVSYEMRLQTNALLGMLTLLGQSDLNKAQQAYAGTAEHSAKTLLKLSDDILKHSKIDSADLDLVPASLVSRA